MSGDPARALRPDLQAVLQPHPDALAAEPGMTAFAVVQAGGEAVIITAVEPQHAAAHVTRRPGLRHLAESGRQDWRC